MLRSITTLICCFALVTSCQKNDDGDNNNNFIPDINFDTFDSINTTLPQYNDLQFPGGSIVINGFGYNGIVIYNTGNTYYAFEITDPNHVPSGCSILNVEGTIATCNCEDGNSYSIAGGGVPFDGTTGQYSLKPYFVETNGNVIRVYSN